MFGTIISLSLQISFYCISLSSQISLRNQKIKYISQEEEIKKLTYYFQLL